MANNRVRMSSPDLFPDTHAEGYEALRTAARKEVERLKSSKEGLLELKQKYPMFTTCQDNYIRDYYGTVCSTVIAKKCTKCGSEFYGEWRCPCFAGKDHLLGDMLYVQLSIPQAFPVQRVNDEIRQFDALHNCPNCGGNLKSRGDYGWSRTGSASLRTEGLDALFGNLTKDIQAEDRKTAKAAAEGLKKYDVPGLDADAAQAETVRNSPQLLRQYLEALLRLDANIFAITERIPQLYYERSQVKRTALRSTFPSPSSEAKKKEAAQAVNDAEQALKAARKRAETEPNVTVPMPKKPTEPELKKPGLFNKAKVQAQNEALTAEYARQCEAYEKQMEVCKAEETRLKAEAVEAAGQALILAEQALAAKQEDYNRITREIEDARAILLSNDNPAIQLQNAIEKEISDAKVLLKKTYAARNSLYAKNVLFYKYRNTAAVSTIYEYLVSGRCDSLTGPNGAYNLYESEKRSDQMLMQLSSVIDHLQRIERTQNSMYAELVSISNGVSSLNTSLEKAVKSLNRIDKNTGIIAKNSEVIAYNTAATAFYSKKTAELTDALGFMVALK